MHISSLALDHLPPLDVRDGFLLIGAAAVVCWLSRLFLKFSQLLSPGRPPHLQEV